MKNNITVKQAKHEIQKKYQDFIMEFVDEYGINILKAATIQSMMNSEFNMAISDIVYDGRILNNKERWAS